MMGRGWRIIGEEAHLHSPLAYSAFEFRCSIERTLIEFFVLIRDHKLSDTDLKSMNSIASVRRAIYRAVGGKLKLERAMLFNRIFSQPDGVPPQYSIAILDIDQLIQYWSRLSEYCHRQLKPNETWQSMGDQWLLDGYALLNEVEKYLWEITITSHVGWVSRADQQPEVRQAYDEFLARKITESDLVTRLRLMTPVLQDRMNRRLRRNAS
jgi:hypothetical protein